MIKYAALTDVGIREKNDDRVMVNGNVLSSGEISGIAEDGLLAVVCDGVGGYSYGDEAAEITVRIFSSLNNQPIDRKAIETAISEANFSVLAAQGTDTAHRNMSSTIAGVWLCGNSFLAFNIGDSKIFRHRNTYLSQLSKDHTYVQELLELGIIKSITDVDEKDRHKITQYIGDISRCKPSIIEGKDRLLENDIFVICSDGVTDVMDNNMIEAILNEPVDLPERCSKIHTAALQNGSQDNISIILLEAV